MADKRNYIVGDYEAITGESVGTPLINVWNYFELDDIFKFELADVVLKQSGVAIPSGNYELAIDTLYTSKETGNSGKTIYAMWRITNATYAGIATTVDGSNFGTMTDNEALYKSFVDLFRDQDIAGNKTFAGETTSNAFKSTNYYSETIQLALEPHEGTTTGDAFLYLFRNANSSGTRSFRIFKGDGTTAVTHLFDAGTGNVTHAGALSKGSGSFNIPHPLPEKEDTHRLVHSFVESPYADNIYSGMTTLKDGKAKINIDKHFKMTEGTFEALNTTHRRHTSNESGFTKIISKLEGNILTIEAEDKKCTDEIFWEVIGERHDRHMFDTGWTDDNGRVIIEPLREETVTEEKVREERERTEQIGLAKEAKKKKQAQSEGAK